MIFKRLVLSAFSLIFGFILAFPQEFKNSQLQITKLEEHLWIIETSDMTTMYLIEGENKALLIDTGTKCDSLDTIIKKITQKPLIVVITHAHGDHDGNINFFKEIYLHPADTVIFRNDYPGKVNFISDSDKFDLGGKTIEVSHMPAHTPGSIILLDRQSGLAFTGDAFGSGQVWLQLRPLAPMKSYINSCNKMLDLMDNGISKIYCGHFPHVKTVFGRQYITTMKEIATSIDNGTAKDTEAYPIVVSIGCDNPMIAKQGQIGIVYDPSHIKF